MCFNFYWFGSLLAICLIGQFVYLQLAFTIFVNRYYLVNWSLFLFNWSPFYMCGHWPCCSGSYQDCSTGPNNFPVRSPAIGDMWQVLVLLLTNSVFSVQTEDSLNVILAEKDSQPKTSLLKPLIKAENQILGSSGKESQPGQLVEENKEEKNVLWRLLNIAAGSLLVLVYMHVAAVFAMIIGVNLESDWPGKLLLYVVTFFDGLNNNLQLGKIFSILRLKPEDIVSC